jgi:GDP-L-fucose synthase
VIPGIIYRLHEAKIKHLSNVTIWGTGTPKREFLYLDDMVRASIHLMNINKKTYDEHVSPLCSHINVGSGEELSIKELAETIKEVVGFKGEINYDPTKPDGVPRKLLDNTRINNFGFKSEVSLKEGLIKTYLDYISKLKVNF